MLKRVHLVSLFVVIYFGACKHDPLFVNPPGTNANVKDSICFEQEVLPLLISNCSKSGCHDDTTRQSGIVLNNYPNLISTLSGTLLLQALRDTGINAMPPEPNSKLSEEQTQLIELWINQGMKINIDCDGPCDSTNITFSQVIYPVIQSNCLGCHNTASVTSTIKLDGYDKIKAQVLSGKLMCSITHGNGCDPMPKNGLKLSECKIALIRKWIEAGMPNN